MVGPFSMGDYKESIQQTRMILTPVGNFWDPTPPQIHLSTVCDWVLGHLSVFATVKGTDVIQTALKSMILTAYIL